MNGNASKLFQFYLDAIPPPHPWIERGGGGSESRQQQVAPFPGGIQEMGNGRRRAQSGDGGGGEVQERQGRVR